MAVRGGKPYSTPKRTTKRINNKSNNKAKTDVTTRIRIDEIRLNDSESLDTSFLEGRIEKQSRKNSSKVKEKILKDNTKKVKKLKLLKKIFFSISIICLFVLLIIVFVNVVKKISHNVDNKTEKVVEVKKESIIDDNYLFVGDYQVGKFNFDDYDLDYHYVKKSDDDLTTSKLIDNIDDYVYIYNPSIVFIQVGINDLNEDKSIDEIIDNYEEIIKLIKKKRPYAVIYIESLYPINKDVDDYDKDIIDDDVNNDKIKDVNKRLESLAEKEKVNYLKIYDVLQSKGKLDKDYTDNGVYLNDEGYKQVLKVVRGQIDKK